MKIKLSLIAITVILILGNCSKSGPSTPTPPAATAPVINADAVSVITSVSASAGANIISDGGASVTSRGACWNTAPNPTIANSKTNNGSGTGFFVSGLTGLTPGTVYYVRSYATNSVGTAYAAELSFTTLVATAVPTLANTTSAFNITTTSASSGGDVTSDGGATVTARGVCWSTTSNPTTANSKTIDGTGTGIFTSNLTGLTAGTVYYVRAYAINSVGTGYGTEIVFTTTPSLAIPTLAATVAVTGITSTTAISGGNVTADGGTAVTARGVCWSISSNPNIGNSKTMDGTGTGAFTSNITGLTPNTVYYVKAYATNSIGSGYGTELSFTSSQTGTITICSQVWMDKNLSVSNYRNGDPIPLVTNSTTWASLTTGAYCYHNNDPASEVIYGKIYNWYAVNDSRGLAPTGWHVASTVDWGLMSTCLGGNAVSGGPIKQTGTTLWASPNTGATNSTGFTALPGGYRANTGTYSSVPGTLIFWWTSNQISATDASERGVVNNAANLVIASYVKEGGAYVRCVKD
jgi:uncharacterized protein (TIGR02145 family)